MKWKKLMGVVERQDRCEWRVEVREAIRSVIVAEECEQGEVAVSEWATARNATVVNPKKRGARGAMWVKDYWSRAVR